ncbi:Tim17-domain-containing protein [Fomitiporia mediterranea MF3/22]|uniref:Tim17-domain-containing protein n=1 Tax=Fomitiporia mediterranea (strain MF3/22) TaxID=694068 RepID=UPI0004408325|nr:Tim17-domain-containing protein [Fomitiporia mediterranea MF3/22]EJD07563.1 Tim17-domain-containing protein [Fomitiporia mediterranea MF3/22]
MSSSQNRGQSAQDSADVLRTATFSTGSSNASTGDNNALTASDLLAGGFDPARLHPMAGLKDQLEYLQLDDDKVNDLPGASTALPSRGWSDDLCYGTGTTYLSGLAIGGLWGLREGAKRPLAVSNARLRINAILNSVTRRGTFIGNSAGVVALVYNAINSTIDGVRGKHDVWGSMAAGGLSGAIYKSTAGVRPALVAATLMTGLAGTWSYVKKAV